MNSTIKSAKNKLIESGRCSPDLFRGCTNGEIRNIEMELGITLPTAYKDFLSIMGRDAGKFFDGADFQYPDVIQFGKYAEGLIEKCMESNYRLPDNAMVFAVDQGCVCGFVSSDDDINDPPVYMFTDDGKEPEKVADSFSIWLLCAVEEEISFARDMDEEFRD